MTTATEPRKLELGFKCLPPDDLQKSMKVYPGWVRTVPPPPAQAAGFIWGVQVTLLPKADARWHVNRIIKLLNLPSGIEIGWVDSALRQKPLPVMPLDIQK